MPIASGRKCRIFAANVKTSRERVITCSAVWEREEVKKVARQLLSRLHELLVLGWRQKIQSRARVRLTIEDVLDDGLPRAYTKELYATKCGSLFEHVFESYQGEGRSVFTA